MRGNRTHTHMLTLQNGLASFPGSPLPSVSSHSVKARTDIFTTLQAVEPGNDTTLVCPKLLELLSRRAVGKLYTATKLASSTSQ